MRRTALLPGARCLLACLLLAAPSGSATAATGVPAWEQSFRRNLSGTGQQTPLAARELADGSRMVVILDNVGVSCVRYDSGGALLSTASFYPSFGWPWGPQLAAIDPFGAVFIVSEADKSFSLGTLRGDIWTMKFDGMTGHALWPSGRTYDSPDHRRDEPLRAAVDPQGDVIVMGATHANGGGLYQVVLKYDGVSGAPQWDPIVEESYSGTAEVDSSGDIYVSSYGTWGSRTSKYSGASSGLLWSAAGPQVMEPLVARIEAGRLVVAGDPYVGFRETVETEAYDAATGALLWAQQYGDPFGSEGQHLLDLALGGRGEVFLLGQTRPSDEYFLLGIDASTGATEWGPADLGGANIEPGLGSLRVAADGDVFVTASVYVSPGFELVTWRYAGAFGAAVWGPVVTTDGSCCDASQWFVDSDGGLFYALHRYSATDLDTVSFQRDPDSGSLVGSEVVFAGVAGGAAYLNDLTLDPAGDVIVTGNAGLGDGTSPWGTIKYDHATGAVVWGRSFQTNIGGSNYWPYQVLTDAAGNAIVAGIGDVGNEQYRLIVQKYAAVDGATLWTSAIIADFYPYGLAVDAAGNPVVLGQVLNSSINGYDNAITKLSGVDGHGLWGPIVYDSGADDYPTSLAMDASGNPVLTGLSYGDQPFWYVLKYAGSSGAVLWGPRTLDNARPNFVTVDPAGDAVVTGYQNQDMVTAKYAGSSGSVVWGPVATPSSGNASSGYWATTDASGDVFVEGSFYVDHGNGVFDYDSALTKFHGADGSVAWGPVLFDGPAHRNDFPYSVVLDAAGNPVVAGETEVEKRSYRVSSIKYDGATGVPLWSPVLLGTPGIQTDVNGLAARGGSVYIGAVVENAYRTFALVETLHIATEAGDVPPATCGQAYTAALIAYNGTPGYSWSVVSGTTPPGVSLSASGQLSGAPTAEGTFAFRVQVQDSVGATAQRDYSITVAPPAFVTVLASTDAACQTTLSVAGSWSGYQWLPGGETTPSIAVAPAETTSYGVLVTDGSGCTMHGEITVAGAPPGQSCAAPVIESIAPESGTAGGGIAIEVVGSQFQPGAWVTIGSSAATGVSVGAQQIAATVPALPAGKVHAVRVTNPDGRGGVLANGWFADFLDLAPAHPFHDFVESIVRAGITSGCGAGNYCPDAAVTREQMAVFLLKAEHGAVYSPPACSGVFVDTPCPGPFTDWIEQLAAEGVTGGCGGGNYCPASPVTRAQMAIFLLKTLLGSAYAPAPASGIFGDVPPGAFAADWIEDLYGRAITGGCSASPLLYCPGASNTRGQMAVFLTKTFGLP